MKFKTEPYAHQLEAFERFKDEPYFALFMEMGTGKSKTAIDIATHKFETKQIDAVLILAPNHVHSQWVREQFPTHCSIPYKSFIWDSAKRPTKRYQYQIEGFLTPKSEKLKVFAVNIEALQSDGILSSLVAYMKNNTVFTIVDEATRIKSDRAKRSKTSHKLEKYGQRCILTGTPVTKSPFGLWSMFEFLKHNFFSCNFFIFQARHGVMIQGINQRTGGRYKTLIDEKTWNMTHNALEKIREQRGGELMPDDYITVSASYGVSEKNVMFIARQKEFKKFKRLDELKTAIDPYTYYATKKECLKDLPEKMYDTLVVEMSKDHRKIYNTLKKQLLVQHRGKELTVVNKVALTTRLSQICGGFFPYEETEEITKDGEVNYVVHKKAMLIGKKNVKLERIKEELEEMSAFPVIIWARFRPELQALYNELKKEYKCCLYYGSTPKHDREQIIDDFKAGEYEIFIGNPSVAGYGLNLQLATTQLFYSNSFDVEARLQAEDRSHRIGVKSACLYKDVVFEKTVDEKITRAIVTGRDMNTFFSQSLDEIFDDEEEVDG